MFLNIVTGGALQTGVNEQEEVVEDKVEEELSVIKHIAKNHF